MARRNRIVFSAMNVMIIFKLIFLRDKSSKKKKKKRGRNGRKFFSCKDRFNYRSFNPFNSLVRFFPLRFFLFPPLRCKQWDERDEKR